MNAERKAGYGIGTPKYRSPESLNSLDLDYSLDYWSLGVCVYLMLTGKYPFDDIKDVKNNDLLMPDPNEKRVFKEDKYKISENVCDFVSQLLKKDLNERLISAHGVKSHLFFSEIDWNLLENGKIIPPIKPCLVFHNQFF